MTTELKSHWEKIFAEKSPDEVSWTQEVPQHSLEMIRNLNLPKTASIIDIGGGDSKLVDFLLEKGFENVSLLDISANAIERAKKRLGPEKAAQVNWIVSDILDFQPEQAYDLWHDRATFHFLTEPSSIAYYTELTAKAVNQYLIIGTFSDNGPEKCSGLPVSQYNETNMPNWFAPDFKKLRCERKEHITPTQLSQEFIFCSFQNKRAA